MAELGSFGSRRLETAYPITDIDCDASGLGRQLEAMVRVFGGSIQKVIVRQSRLLCQDMLDYTVPYSPDPPKSGTNAGRNMKAFERGKKSVDADIDKVFKPLSTANWFDIAFQNDFSVFVAWYYDKVNEGHEVPEWLRSKGVLGVGEWTEFQQRYGKPEFRGSGFYPAPSKKGRKKKRFGLKWDLSYGSLSAIEKVHRDIRAGPKDYKAQMRTFPGIFLVGGGQKKIDAYKKRVHKHIGRLKSGWYHAGMSIGDRPLKASYWIKSQPGDTGIFINDLLDSKEPSLTIGNKIHGNMSKSPGVGMYKLGIKHRAYSIRAEIAARLNRRTRGTIQEYIQDFKLGGLIRSGDDPF